jgi:cytochrome c oxidase assembly protein Cox11
MCAIVKRLRTYGTLVALSLLLGIMVGLTTFSATLYRLFCQATGANGTTQRVAAAIRAQLGRDVTVLFDTNVAPGLPWRFSPVQRSIKLHLGQDTLVFFEAENLSNHDVTGHATFNVTPEKAGIYFKKIQCFCFTDEKLAAGARVQMPVDFYVDPALALDRNTSDVHEITLSYTFFESKTPKGAPDLARFASAPPDAAAGARLFAENCFSCHALDRAKIGPPLGGVLGRRAGSVPGYAYSTALKFAGFTWDEARLDLWLTDPQAELPGAQMPMKLPVVQARRDIVAYLKAHAGG